MSSSGTQQPYSAAEEATLVAAFKGGMTDLDELGDALGKTPGSIAWRLNKLGLLRISMTGKGSGAGNSRTYEYETLVRMMGDRRFKLAMLAALKSGAENAVIGVVRNRSSRYIRRVDSPSAARHCSSGGWIIGGSSCGGFASGRRSPAPHAP